MPRSPSVRDPHGLITLLYNSRPLEYTIFRKQEHQAKVLTSKEIDSHLRKPNKPYKPAPDHPWRQYCRRINGKPISRIGQLYFGENRTAVLWVDKESEKLTLDIGITRVILQL
jgi:hypothetical protein